MRIPSGASRSARRDTRAIRSVRRETSRADTARESTSRGRARGHLAFPTRRRTGRRRGNAPIRPAGATGWRTAPQRQPASRTRRAHLLREVRTGSGRCTRVPPDRGSRDGHRSSVPRYDNQHDPTGKRQETTHGKELFGSHHATITGIDCRLSRRASHTNTTPNAVAPNHAISAVSAAPWGARTDWPLSACANRIANSEA